MSSPIAPYVVRLLTGPKLQEFRRSRAERQRVRKNKPHLVTVYLRINDPYSYVLLQVLEQFAKRYPVKYDFRTVLNLQQAMYPAPELWEKNAFSDGAYLASLYDLNFPAERPQSTRERDAQLTAQLLHWELQPGYLGNARSLFNAYWQGDSASVNALLDSNVSSHVECYQHHLHANEKLLQTNGHYLSGMLHYGDEWYWGLDRPKQFQGHIIACPGFTGLTETTEIFIAAVIDYFRIIVRTETHFVKSPLQVVQSIQAPIPLITVVQHATEVVTISLQ